MEVKEQKKGVSLRKSSLTKTEGGKIASGFASGFRATEPASAAPTSSPISPLSPKSVALKAKEVTDFGFERKIVRRSV